MRENPSQPPNESTELVVKCATCPRCGAVPPYIWPSMYQALCPNDDCDVLFWVPWDTAEENLTDMHVVNWDEDPEL
jgi:hypothetical protein